MIRKIAVGSEVDSYCGRCKMVLNHVVAAMVDDEPRRVRCLTCQSEHNHRVPTVKKARSTGSSRSSKPSSRSSSRSSGTSKWQQLFAMWDGSSAKDYSIYETFSADEWVAHSKFGKGIVIEVAGPDRIIALFESGEKMLMQGKQRKS